MTIKNVKYEFLEVNNIKIYTASMGKETAETPILLLHGFPEFHYSYRYLMPLLAKERKVYAIDQRGYNKSSRPKLVRDYSLKWLMSDVVKVIKKISPNKKVILVGHDWGGAISWHVARYYPKYIEKLIILNCPPIDLLFKALLKIPKQFLMSYYIMFFQIPLLPELLFRLNNFSLLKKLLNSIILKENHMSHEEINNYINCFNRSRGISGINHYRASFRDSIHGRYKPNSKVKCPTLVLWGTKDLALNLKLTTYFHEYVETGLLTLKYFPGVGHFIQQEIPKECASNILGFI